MVKERVHKERQLARSCVCCKYQVRSQNRASGVEFEPALTSSEEAIWIHSFLYRLEPLIVAIAIALKHWLIVHAIVHEDRVVAALMLVPSVEAIVLKNIVQVTYGMKSRSPSLYFVGGMPLYVSL